MVEISYDPARLRLRVKGHAQAGEYGADTVCAALSALVCTLAEAVKTPGSAAIRLQPGDAYIAAAPRPCCAAAVRAAFETVCCGLQLVADSYPQNVRFTTARRTDYKEEI